MGVTVEICTYVYDELYSKFKDHIELKINKKIEDDSLHNILDLFGNRFINFYFIFNNERNEEENSYYNLTECIQKFYNFDDNEKENLFALQLKLEISDKFYWECSVEDAMEYLTGNNK